MSLFYFFRCVRCHDKKHRLYPTKSKLAKAKRQVPSSNPITGSEVKCITCIFFQTSGARNSGLHFQKMPNATKGLAHTYTVGNTPTSLNRNIL